MTERTQHQVERTTDTLGIGKSGLQWRQDALTIEINEVGCPLPRRVVGTVKIMPSAFTEQAFTLHPNGRHQWFPISPMSDVTVEMSEPSLSWSGAGYLDANSGSEPLEDAFDFWTWSRTHRNGESIILYETLFRDKKGGALGVVVDDKGQFHPVPPPPMSPLPRALWRVKRDAHADEGSSASLVQTLEDTPFYTRSIVSSQLLGSPATTLHESLSLDRLRKPWVKSLLPFRMPRRFI